LERRRDAASAREQREEGDMRAAEVMSKQVQTVPPDLAAVEAWDLMRRKGTHHLVVMADSRVLGVLSDRDAGGRNGAAIRARSRVADLMTTSVVTVEPETTIRKIANLMRGRTIGCVPVVDGSRLVGIVTVSDLLEVLGRGVARPARPQRRGLHHRVAHRKTKGGFGIW
jgi:CBS domain-containing protein